MCKTFEASGQSCAGVDLSCEACAARITGKIERGPVSDDLSGLPVVDGAFVELAPAQGSNRDE